jgi:hypothetical protein
MTHAPKLTRFGIRRPALTFVKAHLCSRIDNTIFCDNTRLDTLCFQTFKASNIDDERFGVASERRSQCREGFRPISSFSRLSAASPPNNANLHEDSSHDHTTVRDSASTFSILSLVSALLLKTAISLTSSVGCSRLTDL